jgi:DNA-binding XRE family transcriptional regulator
MFKKPPTCGIIGELMVRLALLCFQSMSISQYRLCVNYEMSRPDRIVHRFGEKMKELRIRRGMTTRALADALGVGHGSISEIENGKRQPGADLVQKTATYFGVSADDLLDDEREVG